MEFKNSEGQGRPRLPRPLRRGSKRRCFDCKVFGLYRRHNNCQLQHASRIQADDGMSTGIIYRREYPVFQPGQQGGAVRMQTCLDQIEQELRV